MVIASAKWVHWFWLTKTLGTCCELVETENRGERKGSRRERVEKLFKMQLQVDFVWENWRKMETQFFFFFLLLLFSLRSNDCLLESLNLRWVNQQRRYALAAVSSIGRLMDVEWANSIAPSDRTSDACACLSSHPTPSSWRLADYCNKKKKNYAPVAFQSVEPADAASSDSALSVFYIIPVVHFISLMSAWFCTFSHYPQVADVSFNLV